MKNQRVDLSLLALFFFSMAFQFFYYRYGLNLWDEGIIYSGAARVMDGESVNSDFFGYQPGRYYLLVLFFKLFGVSVETGRLMWIPLTSLMAVLVLVLSRMLTRGVWAWVPPILLLTAPAMVYSRFFPLFVAVNLFFIFRLTERFGLRPLAQSLLSAGVTFFFSRKRSASYRSPL